MSVRLGLPPSKLEPQSFLEGDERIVFPSVRTRADLLCRAFEGEAELYRAQIWRELALLTKVPGVRRLSHVKRPTSFPTLPRQLTLLPCYMHVYFRVCLTSPVFAQLSCRFLFMLFRLLRRSSLDCFFRRQTSRPSPLFPVSRPPFSVSCARASGSQLLGGTEFLFRHFGSVADLLLTSDFFGFFFPVAEAACAGVRII